MAYSDPLVAKQKNIENLRRIRAQNPGWSTAKNRRYQEANPLKRKAHKWVENQLRLGNIFRGTCENCGSARVEAHHDDYRKPHEIRWLCRQDHVQWHRDHKAVG